MTHFTNQYDYSFLQSESWRIAEEKGFHKAHWELEPWQSNIWAKLMLIVAEIAEAAEELRDATTVGTLTEERIEGGKPVGFSSELADAVIRIMDLCGEFSIDLATVIRMKQLYNETRMKLHGRKA